MKSLKILMMCIAIIFVGACSSNNDDDSGDVVNPVPNFSEFTRDVFVQSANSEPKEVKLGVTFKASGSDDLLDFSDLLN